MEIVFETERSDVISATTVAYNDASVRVLQKSGFIKTGTVFDESGEEMWR